ncbi:MULTISPECIES: long-chain fatty acid--CoA ligase [unclassified Oceanispirochaeta]|uniref:AMP-dependent synthetase/ligase n=1 Tax=unclassified Oceanispirochaeta TaxID=2635722 RepID=UPI000E09622F|nr:MULTISPECIES: AMP-binding protein [unclassified Oceanispirochaeta]MBF9018569.1 AMP-binding protein [Oceanispirochaeta sp. M2]NPD75024.1 AMP-binding protein [Oceanispirochaeta sp. M1]RDG29145.1 long-chain fatty acid--CoA ligase [Oceanispirochaeta sp. M1]
MEEKGWSWLDQYRETHIQGEWPTIPEMFKLAQHRFPDKVCFRAFSPIEVEYTYTEAINIIKKTAAYLVDQGIKKGDRVAMTGKNSPAWAMAYLSVVEIGAVIVPLDYQMEKDTISRILDFVEAPILFVDKERYDELGNAKGIKEKISLSPHKDNYILDLPESSTQLPEGPKEDDMAAVLFTSGTTGKEKGVMLSHKNFSSDAFQANKPFLNVVPEDILYALLPLHHSYCMTAVFLESLSIGCELVFAGGLSVTQMMNDLKKGKITVIMGIPLLYNKILKGMMKQVRAKGVVSHVLIGILMRISGFVKRVFDINIGKKIFGNILLKKANLYTIKYMICGGGPLATETFRRYQELGLDFVQGYGMTETAPISTLNPAHAFRLKSVGKVFPLVDMKILNPDNDGIGEIIMKGPICCKGYYKNEEATKELFTEDGYLKTGDLGYLDKDNYLYLTGRAKSLIVTEGGKNVFPEEIEDHFQLYQQIDQILIVSYLANAETRGEGIEALIYPNKEHYDSLSIGNDEKIKEDMMNAVKEVNRELLAYKRISKLRILDEPMEMTTTKKIKRPKVIAYLKEKEDTGFLL